MGTTTTNNGQPAERNFAGRIVDMEHSKTANGKAYLRLKIEGIGWGSCWEELERAPNDGEVWAFNVSEKETNGKRYKNFMDMLFVPQAAQVQQPQQQQATAPAIPTPQQQQTRDAALAEVDKRERRMARCSALSSAATFLQPAADKNIKVLLAYAEECYKWVNE